MSEVVCSSMQDALNILKTFPEVAKCLISSLNEKPNVFRNLFTVKGSTVPALGANHLVFTLEPTNTLRELLSTLITGKGYVGIIVNQITSSCHVPNITTQASR
jgi:hypothetical protein